MAFPNPTGQTPTGQQDDPGTLKTLANLGFERPHDPVDAVVVAVVMLHVGPVLGPGDLLGKVAPPVRDLG